MPPEANGPIDPTVPSPTEKPIPNSVEQDGSAAVGDVLEDASVEDKEGMELDKFSQVSTPFASCVSWLIAKAP
jgi:hypothetical protein